MVKELFIVRHGQTVENLERIVQGQLDGTLTIEGEEQAHELGRKLSDKKFDKIYTSDLLRAGDTTQMILGYLIHFPFVEYTADLRERGYGHMQGMSYKEAGIDSFSEAELYAMGQEGIFHDIEPLENVKERVKRIKERIINSKDSKVLIVAHEGFNSYLMNELLGEEITAETFHPQKNCAVSYFKLDEQGKVLKHEIGKDEI